MAAIPSGAGDLANSLLTQLIAGKNFTFPAVDLSGDIFKQPGTGGPLHTPVEKLESTDLTTGTVGGDGVFDKIMASLVAHLKVEYAANRISGAEYTKAYIGVVEAALSTAAQFLLGKDQAYWQAILVQQQAQMTEVQKITARIELEIARFGLVRAQYEAATTEANYGLTKLKIATEDASYAQLTAQTDGVTYTNLNLLPAQLEQTQKQTARTVAETVGVTYTNTDILPAQKGQLVAQTSQITAQVEGITYTNANILPQQKTLLVEQTEVQRAQTLDIRSDGADVVGLIGKQKDLYAQQITSYKRDAETKFLKIYSDAWITQKTIDEGLIPPTQFTNAEINEVLEKLRTNLDLDVA